MLKYLEALRKKLLDVSGRNNLISFKHSLKSPKQIRLINDSLEQIYLKFCEDNSSCQIFGLEIINSDFPDENTTEFINKLDELRVYDNDYILSLESLGDDPSDKAVLGLENDLKDKVRDILKMPKISRKQTVSLDTIAIKNKINPSFDLSIKSVDSKLNKKSLQTLLSVDDLQRKLKNIYEYNHLNESETGVSTLYCALGFLEWYESENSEKKIISPLILLPIKLKRTLLKGEHSFSIERRDDDIKNNASIYEKLKNDFGIVFPEFKEEGSLGDFFNSCNIIISKYNNWKIRNYSTIGFFSFSKFSMYQDIKVENLSHINLETTLVNKIINGSGNLSGLEFNPDYEIDKDEKIQAKIPDLITDADSSQLSAIMDVLEGKNLVIEGPPGTGKSQTITNIIAACIANGKKVLFLAEKITALEVVKKRLDNAGIGDFCLELHSNKLQKSIIYKKLEKNINIRENKKSKETFKHVKDKIEETKNELKNYIKLLSERNVLFDKNYQELIWRKANLETILGEINTRVIQKLVDDKLIVDYKENERYIERFQEKFENINVKELNDGKWSFLDYSKVEPFNAPELLSELELLKINLAGVEFAESSSLLRDFSLNDILSIVHFLSKNQGLSHIDDKLISDILKNKLNILSCKEFLNSLVEISNCRDKAKSIYSGKLEDLFYIPFGDSLLLEQFYSDLKIDEIPKLRSDIKKQFFNNDIAYKKLVNFSSVVPWSLEDIRAFKIQIENLIKIKDSNVQIANELTSLEGFREISIIQQLLFEKDKILDQINATFKPDIVKYDLNTLYRWRHVVIKSNVFSVFNSEFRTVKRELGILYRYPFNKHRISTDLITTHSYHEKDQEIQKNKSFISLTKSGQEITKGNINQVLKVYELFYEAKQNLSKFFNLEIENILSMDYIQLNELLSEVIILEKSIAYFGVNTFKQYSINLSEMFCELDLIESNKIIGNNNLTIRELCSFNSIIKNYNILATTLKKQIENYSYFKDLNEDEIYQTISFIEEIKSSPSISLSVKENPDWVGFIKIPKDEVNYLDKEMSKITTAIGSYISRWGCTDIFRDLNIKNIVIKIDLLLEDYLSFKEAVDYHYVRKNYNGTISDFIEVLEKNNISFKYLHNCYEYYAVFNELGKFFKSNPFLMIDAGSGLNALREKFSSLDKDLMTNYQQLLVNQLCMLPIETGISQGRVSDKTELGFIQHQFDLKMRHAPIRLLLKKSSKAMQDMMPCFMMSPLSVSQFIPIGSLSFDVLIMDEASQLRPEDSVGALFRAKQVVIVGDPKQLPPSSFFNTNDSNSIQDEIDEDGNEVVTIDHESILDMALNSFRPARRLKWHYRSKHQDLISFSNTKFYDGELVVFPSPTQNHELFGLEYIYVKDGVYENRRNIKEAEELLDWIQKFIIRYPEKSFAIVTMNQPQQELIKDLFDRRLKSDPILEAYYKSKENTSEEVIIKNLENIQGDERDIVLISTVYGREPNISHVKQRFGPINHPMGHRRLNVLFTRARYKNVIFSSLDSSDILPSTNSSQGLYAFKEYLHFAKTKILNEISPTTGEPDSDFEIFVMTELKRNGFEVVAQVGVSGYKIDIGVIDPNNKGRYLCGIECDGATYHSAKSVRDRDKIRQQILESLGWNIYRIWSTDWFSNKQHEVRKMINFLQSLK